MAEDGLSVVVDGLSRDLSALWTQSITKNGTNLQHCRGNQTIAARSVREIRHDGLVDLPIAGTPLGALRAIADANTKAAIVDRAYQIHE
jgi:hypothetical protein